MLGEYFETERILHSADLKSLLTQTISNGVHIVSGSTLAYRQRGPAWAFSLKTTTTTKTTNLHKVCCREDYAWLITLVHLE